MSQLYFPINVNIYETNSALRSAFPSSCRGLRLSALAVRPIGANNWALRAQTKMLKIHLESFADIHSENFAEICLKFFAKICLKVLWKSVLKILHKIYLKILGNICLENFVEILLKIIAEIRLTARTESMPQPSLRPGQSLRPGPSLHL